jgi:nitrous oxidase accessory protein
MEHAHPRGANRPRLPLRRCIALYLAAILGGAGFLRAPESQAQSPDHAAPTAPLTPATAQRELGEIGRRLAAAAPGQTVAIPPGIYREHIVIDKAVTLVGTDRPVIDGGGRGDVVQITVPGVTLRGFTIRNSGIDLDTESAGIRCAAAQTVIEDNVLEDVLFGIDLRESPGSVIRGNRIGGKDLDIARRGDGIRLWRADDALVENNTIHDGRDAILWYSRGVTVRGNTSLRCRYGFHLMYSDSVVIEDNRISANSVGVYLMYSKDVTVRRNHLLRNRGPSGYGLGLKETDRFVIEHNLIIGNRVGVYLDGSPFTTAKPGEFSFNTIACNDIGVTFLPSVRGNQFTENNFIDNIEQVCVLGRGELRGNDFWREDRGNFWTDYVGYDENRDGVGDFVHESQTLFENMMDKEPKLRLLLFSPAQQAIEFVGRAIPAIRPEPKFTDEVPLMSPARTEAGAPDAALPRSQLAGVGAGLLALGAGVLRLARWAPPSGSGPRSDTHKGAQA